jgi:hypothetical protein
MVHGDCKSAGCFAMTDARIEEIYALARKAFDGGQAYFHVHVMPFRMTASNMTSHQDSPWYPFWLRLKEGYDSFEATGKPPIVKVCGKQYMVNVSFPGLAGDPGPSAACPVYAKIDPATLPGIDGAQGTAVAGLSKPGTQWNTVQIAEKTPAEQESEQASAAAADGSASLAGAGPATESAPAAAPVAVDTPAPPPTPRRALIASARTPKPPASPIYDDTPARPGDASPAPVSAATVSAEEPENYLTPSVNRTGKSSKLPAAPRPAPLSSG